jgi:hypothetical protein
MISHFRWRLGHAFIGLILIARIPVTNEVPPSFCHSPKTTSCLAVAREGGGRGWSCSAVMHDWQRTQPTVVEAKHRLIYCLWLSRGIALNTMRSLTRLWSLLHPEGKKSSRGRNKGRRSLSADKLISQSAQLSDRFVFKSGDNKMMNGLVYGVCGLGYSVTETPDCCRGAPALRLHAWCMPWWGILQVYHLHTHAIYVLHDFSMNVINLRSNYAYIQSSFAHNTLGSLCRHAYNQQAINTA